MKKLLILALTGVMVFAMTGCGTSSAPEIESSYSSETGMANPWVYDEKANIEELAGVSLNEPEGAQDVQYGYCFGLDIMEMKFTDEAGTEITARAGKTTEATDISGMDGTTIVWDTEGDDEINGMAAKFMTCKDDGDGDQIQLYTWYDADAGISYSVMSKVDSTVDMNGFDLLGYVYAICPTEA